VSWAGKPSGGSTPSYRAVPFSETTYVRVRFEGNQEGYVTALYEFRAELRLIFLARRWVHGDIPPSLRTWANLDTYDLRIRWSLRPLAFYQRIGVEFAAAVGPQCRMLPCPLENRLGDFQCITLLVLTTSHVAPLDQLPPATVAVWAMSTSLARQSELCCGSLADSGAVYKHLSKYFHRLSDLTFNGQYSVLTRPARRIAGRLSTFGLTIE